MTQSALPLEDRILQTASPQQIVTKERLEADRKKAEEQQNRQPLTALAAYVQKAVGAAVRAKQSSGVHDTLVKCLNQRKGKYDADVLAEIQKTNGSTVFMKLTGMKCRAAEAWIKDIILPAGERPWSLTPSEVPELPDNIEEEITKTVTLEAATVMRAQGIEAVTPEQVAQRLQEIRENVRKERLEQAEKATELLSARIEDELQSGGYYQALEDFIIDFVTFPAAFLKGPIIKRKKTLVWQEGPDGAWRPVVSEKLFRCYERVSPFDMFPSPGARSVQDGYLCERIRLRRRQLVEMIGSPGWSELAIRGVLYDYQYGYFRDDNSMLVGDYQRAQAEGRPQEFNDPDPPLTGWIFNGPIRGRLLLDWGMSPQQIKDPLMDYEAVVVLFGRWVVMARLNPHPLGQRLYYSASFSPTNDSIWGEGVPQLMRDTQRVCNAAARALVNNMGIASGPQVEANMDRLYAGQDVTRIWPWKIWQTKESRMPHGKPAINFYQPNLLADALLAVYEYFFKQASEQSGIPAYMYGNERVGGAGKTASGLSMLLNSATKTLKNVVGYIDRNIIQPTIKEHWTQIMLYDEDVEKWGDIEVIARASEYLIVQEQLQLRRTEFLQQTNNPVDLAIMGEEGRAEVLRETVKSLKMPTKKVVPSREELLRRKQLAASMPPASPQPMPPVSPQSGAIPFRPAAMAPDGGAMGKEPGRMMGNG